MLKEYSNSHDVGFYGLFFLLCNVECLYIPPIFILSTQNVLLKGDYSLYFVKFIMFLLW